jgi:hypothetical protein
MIFRIFIILMIIIFQDQIFNVFKKFKIDTVGKAKKTVMKNTKKMVGNIINNEVNTSLEIVKKLDKPTHKKCIKIIKNIHRIKDDVENNRHIDFKNEFENMKLQKKEILNIIASLVVSRGFFSSQDSVLKELEDFINNMLIELLDLVDKKEYDINWFEDNIYEAEPNDTGAPNFSYHYNLF